MRNQISRNQTPISQYIADSSFDPQAALKLIAVSGLIGMAFGFIASFLGINGVYVTGLVPIVVGLCMGGLLAFAQQLTKNRNIIATATASVVASVVCVAFLNWFEYRQFVDHLDKAYLEQRQIVFLSEEFEGRENELPEHVRNEIANRAASAEALEYLRIDSFKEFIAYKANRGGQVSLQNKTANPNGKSRAATLSTWAIEWFLMTGLVAFAATRLRRPPFCSECQRWLEASPAGQFAGDAERVADCIQAGDFNSIKHIEAGESMTRLVVHLCPECRSENNAVLEVRDAGSEQSGVKFVVTMTQLDELAGQLPEMEDASATLNFVNELGASVREVTSASNPETNPDSVVQEYMAKLMNRSEE